jgi:hypothetical protein
MRSTAHKPSPVTITSPVLFMEVERVIEFYDSFIVIVVTDIVY